MMRLSILLAALVLAANAAAPAPAADEPGVYELRLYVANEGKLDALHARFRDHTDALFRKHGMTPVGYWTPADDKDGKADTLLYILRHDSREAAARSWAAFGADEEWKSAKAASERDGVLVKKVETTFLVPTDYSPELRDSKAEAARVFEMRTYVASPGKFEDLHKRFRDHTLGLFKKHGLENVAYFVPTDDDRGKADTLIYLVATPTREASKAAWKAFLDDPEWKQVFQASQPDGVPLAAKITSLFLEPTDYSPIR
jgi:hypothetical protein